MNRQAEPNEFFDDLALATRVEELFQSVQAVACSFRDRYVDESVAHLDFAFQHGASRELVRWHHSGAMIEGVNYMFTFDPPEWLPREPGFRVSSEKHLRAVTFRGCRVNVTPGRPQGMWVGMEANATPDHIRESVREAWRIGAWRLPT